MRYRGTRQTVSEMERLAAGPRGGQSLRLRLLLEHIARHVPARDVLSLIAAIYHWFLEHYTFVPDPVEVELVRDPEAVLADIARHGRFLGDCDDASVFLSACCQAVGLRPQFLRVGFRSRALGDARYSHVLVTVHDQYGRRLALDPVAGRRTPRMLGNARAVAFGLER